MQKTSLELLKEYLAEAEGEGKDVELSQVFTKHLIEYVEGLQKKAAGK